MSKYEPLTHFLENIQPSTNIQTLSFSEIERILGFKLPSSAYEHRAWWSNPTSPADHPHAQSWLEAGWKVDEVDQLERRVHFRRIRTSGIGKSSPHAVQPSPSLGMQIDLNKPVTTSPWQNESKRMLLDLGFENCGEWIYHTGTLQFQLTRHENEQQILYAFIAQDEVKYIGKSNQTLIGRMNGYKNPGPTQRTNIDKKARIEALLQKGIPVQILVLVPKEELSYRGVPINIAGGLEDNLISRIRPPWNNRL